jgi:hypothetical protein
MNALITSMTVEATHQIDAILAAVFGMQGHKQDDIPMAMRIGDAKNPAVQVFGGGVWLQDQPNNGLPEWAGEIGKQMVSYLIAHQDFKISNSRNRNKQSTGRPPIK